MNEAQQNLYRRVSEFSFDEGDEELPFARRLARENGWTSTYAGRALEEYKRFMLLAVVAEHPVTPSDQVDQVWHLHLTYTRSYWDRWCHGVLKTPVHHGPTKGGGDEGRKFERWYENTRDSYRRVFAQSPPADIWPEPSIRFGIDLHHQRINTRSHWVIPKPWRRARGQSFASVVVPTLAGVGGLSLFAQGEQQAFPTAIGVAVAILLIITLSHRAASRRGDKDRLRHRWMRRRPRSWWERWSGGCGGDSGCGAGGCGGGGCGGGGCGGCGGCGG